MSDQLDLAISLDRFVRRVHAGLHRHAIEFDNDHIGPFGGLVLMTLADLQPTAIQNLSDTMARDKAQMTRILRSLEGKGVVQRQDSPDDGRVTLISLTPKGMEFVHLVRSALSQVISDLLEPLTPSERKSLGSMFQKL